MAGWLTVLRASCALPAGSLQSTATLNDTAQRVEQLEIIPEVATDNTNGALRGRAVSVMNRKNRNPSPAPPQAGAAPAPAT